MEEEAYFGYEGVSSLKAVGNVEVLGKLKKLFANNCRIVFN